MSMSIRIRRLMSGALLACTVAAGMVSTARAAEDNPDFYATIVAADAGRRTLVVSPSQDQSITIDVGQLGSAPWDEGAFAVNNVVLLRTMRVGGALVATGWEQARDGSEEFEGVERRREDRQRDDKDDELKPPRDR